MEIPEPLPGFRVSFESPDKEKDIIVLSIPNTNQLPFADWSFISGLFFNKTNVDEEIKDDFFTPGVKNLVLNNEAD